MKKRYVISSLPIKMPFQSTILYSFLLYYFKADGLLWGIFITLYSIIWILCIYVRLNEESISLNESEKDKPKSKIQERMNELINNLKK